MHMRRCGFPTNQHIPLMYLQPNGRRERKCTMVCLKGEIVITIRPYDTLYLLRSETHLNKDCTVLHVKQLTSTLVNEVHGGASREERVCLVSNQFSATLQPQSHHAPHTTNPRCQQLHSIKSFVTHEKNIEVRVVPSPLLIPRQ